MACFHSVLYVYLCFDGGVLGCGYISLITEYINTQLGIHDKTISWCPREICVLLSYSQRLKHRPLCAAASLKSTHQSSE